MGMYAKGEGIFGREAVERNVENEMTESSTLPLIDIIMKGKMELEGDTGSGDGAESSVCMVANLGYFEEDSDTDDLLQVLLSVYKA